MKKYMYLLLLVAATLPMQAQDVLTVPADAQSIAPDQAGNYDRVDEAWPMQAGSLYLIALPAQLDAYYFGPEAARRRVTDCQKQDDGTYVVTTTEMDDADNFAPNQAYVVTPTIEIQTISHISPGIKTRVEPTPEGHELLHVDGQSVLGIGQISCCIAVLGKNRFMAVNIN